jgi:hypothetical protein
MLRAYDNNTDQVGAVLLPARQSGGPMTCMVDGKQYIIVVVSGGITRASTWRSRFWTRRSGQQPACSAKQNPSKWAALLGSAV